ncbi:MAG: competence protein ComEC family protein [Cyclobacteriaceae bacterium]|nr:ComEC/Rec2 family competence protein [Cyclobacteriaceae bacterium]MCH8517534.1 competence protein ComEC family protein [Cyclobacteriaceae bacterium]
MNNFSKYPIFKHTFFLILGVLIYHQFAVKISTDGLVIIVAILSALSAHFIFIKKAKIWYSNLRSITFCIIMIFAGYGLSLHHDATQDPKHLLNQTKDYAEYIIQISSPAEEKNKTFGYDAKVIAARQDSVLFPVNGKIKLYISKKAANLPVYGDIIISSIQPKRVEGSKNPNQFDYAAFLALSDIYHQTYLPEGSFTNSSINQANPFFTAVFKLRAYTKGVLSEYLWNADSKAITQALLMGDKSMLEDQLKNAYANVGAMHVLAVSGLHVGIIYLLLTLGMRRKTGKWRATYIIGIVLPVLWFYAAFTGLQPSVLRAVTMFSLLAIGQINRRAGNVYNTLLLSAFILLLFNPKLIYTVSFQLSYTALAGILIFQPILEKQLKVKNRIAKSIWQISTVGIAAQITTFPLGLYYFNQFPNYFLLSNLIVIKAATVELLAAIALVISSAILSLLAVVIGQFIDVFITNVNRLIYMIDSLPASTIQGVSISLMQTFTLYTIIISLALIIFWGMRIKYAIPLFIATVLFSSESLLKYKYLLDQTELVIYHDKHTLRADLFSSGQLAKTISSSDPESTNNFSYSGHRIHNTLNNKNETLPESLSLEKNTMLKLGDDLQLLIINEYPGQSINNDMITPHASLLLNVYHSDYDELIAQADEVIISPSMKTYQRHQLNQLELKKVIDIGEKGAIIYHPDIKGWRPYAEIDYPKNLFSHLQKMYIQRK